MSVTKDCGFECGKILIVYACSNLDLKRQVLRCFLNDITEAMFFSTRKTVLTSLCIITERPRKLVVGFMDYIVKRHIK